MDEFMIRRDEREECARAVCRSCRLGIPHATDDRGIVWDLHDNTDARQPCYHHCPAGPIWKRGLAQGQLRELTARYRDAVGGEAS